MKTCYFLLLGAFTFFNLNAPIQASATRAARATSTYLPQVSSTQAVWNPIRAYFRKNPNQPYALVHGSRLIPNVKHLPLWKRKLAEKIRFHHYAMIVDRDLNVLSHYSFSPYNTVGNHKLALRVTAGNDLKGVQTHIQQLKGARPSLTTTSPTVVANWDMFGLQNNQLQMKLLPVQGLQDPQHLMQFHEFMTTLSKWVDQSDLKYAEQALDCTAIKGCIDYFKSKVIPGSRPPIEQQKQMTIVQNGQTRHTASLLKQVPAFLGSNSDLMYYAGPTHPVALRDAMQQAFHQVSQAPTVVQ